MATFGLLFQIYPLEDWHYPFNFRSPSGENSPKKNSFVGLDLIIIPLFLAYSSHIVTHFVLTPRTSFNGLILSISLFEFSCKDFKKVPISKSYELETINMLLRIE